MKKFNEVYEGILAGMEDTISRGENDIKQVYYNEILSMFNIDKKAKYDDIITFVSTTGSPAIRTEEKINIIKKCCEYDGKILSINLDNLKNGYNYAIVLIISGKEKRIPPIKVVSYNDRLSNKIPPGSHFIPTISVSLQSQKSININDYIHKDSIVESIAINGISLLHNAFDFKVRRIAEYNICIEKIYKTKWPKCEIKFTRYTQLSIMLQLTDKPMSDLQNISSDYVTGNIII